MKLYNLLRNNRESGPYTLRELTNLGLAATDLIWIEGESMAWMYASDVEELKAIAEKGIKIPLAAEPARISNEKAESTLTDSVFGNSPIGASPEANKPVNAAEDYSIYLAEKEKPIEWKAKSRKRTLAEVSNNLFGLGVLLIGAMMCAFVVKKLVEQFDIEQPQFSAEAVEITNEILPSSATVNLAKTTQQSSKTPTSIESTTSGPMESLPEEIVQPTVAKNKVTNQAKISQTVSKQEADANIASVIQDDVVAAESAPEIIVEKAVEKIVKKPSITVAANEYNVGVFGGISDLELSVSNPSSVAVEKAVVEIEYLKPNGSVVKSHTLTIENISAGGTKKLPVPSSNRGVKVRYHVVSVTAANDNIAATNM